MMILIIMISKTILTHSRSIYVIFQDWFNQVMIY